MAAGQVREQTAQTAYDGQEITYDGNGNPLSYRGWTMSWQGGRQLASMTGSSKSLSFEYGESGLRLSKTCTVDDSPTVHTYTWNGSLLSSDVCGNTALYFHYDANGSPMGFTLVNSEGSTGYFYVKNLQGDILKVIDAAGSVHASYTYDAWGNILSSSGTLADVNPLRYRGYYYDSETGLYYLQSRYYGPEVGRFINADSYASTGQGIIGCNMFAYCNNNPVKYDDQGGEWIDIAIGAAVGGLIGGVSAALKGGDVGDIIGGVVSGALSGGLCAAGGVYLIAGAFVNFGYTFATSEGSISNRFWKGAVAGASTFVFGSVGNYYYNRLKELAEEAALSMAELMFGAFIFDVNYGIVAEVVSSGSQQFVDNVFSGRNKKKQSGFYRNINQPEMLLL